MLPVIKKSMQVQVPEEVRESYIVEALQPELYLDVSQMRKKYYVSARLEFAMAGTV